MHCLFSAVLMLASQVFFKGQMEYAIISFSVVEKIYPWLFMCYYLIFYESDGIINGLIDFKGVNEIASLFTRVWLIFTGAHFGKRSAELTPKSQCIA